MDINDFAAYMKIGEKLVKMEGFFKFDISSVPEVYERKYVDDNLKNMSVTGARTKILYAFDRMKNSLVHGFLARVSDLNLKGKEACTEIVLVDFTRQDEGGFYAVSKRFAVLCKDARPEEGFLDYYGTLLSISDAKAGVASSEDEFETIDFSENRRGILCDLNS